MKKKIILTGDRPTGALHIGHYVGSLQKRIEMQNTSEYEQFVMIADMQALTDNADDPVKIRQNVMEVLLDYISVGLDPEKTHFCVQSQIPALYELPMFYANLVTMARLERNPTIKAEIQLRNFERNIPVGFITYPISQAADITAFQATHVPVGVDQLPMIEQTREIVSSFNRIYCTNLLVEPQAILPDKEICHRFVGTDGNTKMSKSLGNCIYLKDDMEIVKKKIMSMYTDPTHLRIQDPGKLEGNTVFIYLDAFCREEHFKRYLSEYSNLDELKDHYTKGGLGDVKVKGFLYSIVWELLEPIHRQRKKLEGRKEDLFQILREGTRHSTTYTNELLQKVRDVVGVNYFNDASFYDAYVKK